MTIDNLFFGLFFAIIAYFVVAVVNSVISFVYFFLKSLHYLHVAVCSPRSTFTLGTVSESSRVNLLSSQNWVGAIRVTYGALAASCLSSTEALCNLIGSSNFER